MNNLSIEDINKKIQELEYDIDNNNVDISMSNNVNELDIDYIKKDIDYNKNDENINNDGIEKFDENIDLDEIIYNQEISNNEFIKYISDNSNLNNDPYISTIKSYFFKKNYYNIFKKSYNNKIIVIILRILHILEILYLLFGIFLPSKLLPIYIIFCIKHLIFWDIFDNKHYISILVEKLSNTNYYDLFNENIYKLKILLLISIFVSIFGIVMPQHNLYRIIYLSINRLNKFN